jgi:protein N-terminal amidase
MDLNPYQFRAAWDEFEFARHVVRHKAKLVLMPLAWVTVQDAAEFHKGAATPDKATLDYWIRRFEPLGAGSQPGQAIHEDEETIVVLANQCGHDADNLYAGTSSVLGFSEGKPRVYAVASRSFVGLTVADTSLPYKHADQRLS